MKISAIRSLSTAGKPLAGMLTAFALSLAFAGDCFAVLRHNYLFNSGDGTTVVDSVAGGLNGTAVGGTIDIADSRFVLDGVDNYVNFDGPSLAINTYSALTLELWSLVSTVHANQYTATVAFGGTDAGGAGINYIMMQPTRGGAEGSSGQIIDVGGGGESRVNTMQDLSDGRIHHTVLTISATEVSYYVDGVQIGTAPLDAPSLAGVSTQSAFLGDSVWNGDPILNGALYEFRIYDDVKSPADVTNLFNAGCQAGCGNLYMEVDRNTGAATLFNGLSDKDMVSYRIDSAKGALNTINWLSITGNYDQNDGGELDNDDEWEILSQTKQLLREQDPLAGGANDGADFDNTFALGNIWTKSPFEDSQVTLTVLDQNLVEQQLAVPVFFINGVNNAPYSRSDLNLNGAIDTSDYLILRANHLATLAGTLHIDTFALGDINGDLLNNYQDFRLFKADFIAANGAAAFASLMADFGAVPEPGTMGMLTLGVMAGVLASRRKRVAKGVRKLCAETHNSSESYCTMNRVCRTLSLITLLMTIPAVGNAQTVVGSQNFDTATLGDFQTVSGVQGARQYVCCSAMNPMGSVVSPGVGGSGNMLRVQHDLVTGGFNVGGAGFQLPLTGNISPNRQDYGIEFDIRLVQGEAYSGPLNFEFNIMTGATFSQQGGSVYNLMIPAIDGLVPGGDFMHVSQNLGTPSALFFNESVHWNPLAPPGFVATEFNSVGGPAANVTQIYEIDNVQLIMDIATSLALVVDPTNGKARIRNVSVADVTFDYYRIESNNGSLLTANFNGTTGWNSLDDQGLDSIGAGVGESWDEVVNANSANRLVEQFLLGDTTLGPGQSLSLGAPVNAAVLNNQINTLALRFGGAAYDSEGIGQVIFEDLSALAGDYNGNGAVDAADYVVWRNNPSAFGGDPGGYNTWRQNFGASLGAGTASGAVLTAIPEPVVGLLCSLAMCLAVGARLDMRKGRA